MFFFGFTYDIPFYGIAYWLMFYLPKILPLTVIGFYFFRHFKYHAFNKFFNSLGHLALLSASIIGVAVLVGFACGLPLSVFFGTNYTWSYEAALEWVFCFIGCWLLTEDKLSSASIALTYGTIAISAGGGLHEFAFFIFNVNQYFHLSYPLFLSTQVFCLIFLVFFLKEHWWKPTKLFAVALTIYVVFTALYATVFNPNSLTTMHFQDMWIQRLPTIFLLLSIPFGFRRGMLATA